MENKYKKFDESKSTATKHWKKILSAEVIIAFIPYIIKKIRRR